MSTKKSSKKPPAKTKKAREMAKTRMAPARAGALDDADMDRVAGGGALAPNLKFTLCTNE
jgi:hypothetical protein